MKFIYTETPEKKEEEKKLKKADARHFRWKSLPYNILINKKSSDAFLLTCFKTIPIMSAEKEERQICFFKNSTSTRNVSLARPSSSPWQKTLFLPHPINFHLKKHHHTYFMWLDKKSKTKKSSSASIKKKMKSMAKKKYFSTSYGVFSRYFFPQIFFISSSQCLAHEQSCFFSYFLSRFLNPLNPQTQIYTQKRAKNTEKKLMTKNT